MDDEGAVYRPEPTQTNALLASVISVPLYLTPRLILSSALKRIEDELRSVSHRAENVSRVGSSEDIKATSELTDSIRDAVINRQVSGGTHTGSTILITNRPSAFYRNPAHLESPYPRRRGPVSDARS